MDTLFSLPPVVPEGFGYYPDFLSPAEEEALIKEIVTVALKPFHFQGFEAKRKVASFGYDYHFDNRTLTKGAEIPEFLFPLLQKAGVLLSRPLSDFAEVLLTEYPDGSVINWHRDAPPFEVIVGISLHADCTFRFRPHEKAKQNRSATRLVPVKRRSLYVIEGPARSEWQHSTLPVQGTRYSITLRTLKTPNP